MNLKVLQWLLAHRDTLCKAGSHVQKGVCMFAVRTRRGYLATFASKPEAEQWLRDWTANHGHRAWIERTEL